jgi:ribA/ribD-fused uncharacterized protein
MNEEPFWKNYAIHNDEEVLGFFGDYRWLSNFHMCPVMWNGRIFPSSEHAYQFAKIFGYDKEVASTALEAILNMRPSKVKTWGKVGFIRPDWNKLKFSYMYSIVLDKFMRNSDLKEKLLETGDRYLEETNHWKDTIWGVDYISNEGANHLGVILMDVRSVLQVQPREERKET